MISLCEHDFFNAACSTSPDIYMRKPVPRSSVKHYLIFTGELRVQSCDIVGSLSALLTCKIFIWSFIPTGLLKIFKGLGQTYSARIYSLYEGKLFIFLNILFTLNP